MNAATETLTRPAPVETVTPIKPSEAIRLGCLIAPVQAFAEVFGGQESACVIGALALGYGYDGPRDDSIFMADVEAFLQPHLDPVEWFGPLWRRNDGANGTASRWSRERIADWLSDQGL